MQVNKENEKGNCPWGQVNSSLAGPDGFGLRETKVNRCVANPRDYSIGACAVLRPCEYRLY